MKKLISGWGKNKYLLSDISLPKSNEEVQKLISQNNIIPAGAGNSYGDSALFDRVIYSKNFNGVIKFEKDKGFIEVYSGTTINELNEIIIPQGWFLPVTPGTSLATIGGIISSDAHGKNHHLRGTISNFVISLKIIIASGDILEISKNISDDLFYATCGGMGLTGFIISAKIQLVKITSIHVDEKKIKTTSIKRLLEMFDEFKNNEHTVSWLNCNNQKLDVFESVFSAADYSSKNLLKKINYNKINVYPSISKYFLNDYTIKVFNKLYYRLSSNSHSEQNLLSFFYPLDKIKKWNSLYGKSGFFQYQFVIPDAKDLETNLKNLQEVLFFLKRKKITIYLAVLKKLGKKNKNILSFPIEGYTLALDMKCSEMNANIVNYLDDIIINMKGRVYLAKDCFLNENKFKKMYPDHEKFQNIREKYRATKKFISLQSIRLGLS